MRLEDEQYEEIKRTVIDTFSVYGIRCIPISAFEMATKMGIKVIPYSALSEEKRSAAMRESKDGFSIGSSRSQEWMIFYNDACESYGRINQTIMHEIGHYAMGHSLNVTLWDCGRQQRESSTTCSTRTNMSRISKISISCWSTGTGMFPVTMVHRTQRYSCCGIKEPTGNGTASGSITIPEETKVNRKQIQNMQTT